MGLDLTPRDYLEMLTEEYLEYQEHWHAHRYRVSMRKAINCCGLSNALPEIIIAHLNPTEPEKVLRAKVKAYREHLGKQCEAHHTVRDICDYSKHGPKLTRPSVSVQDAKRIKREEGFPSGLLLALTQPHDVERLMVTHQDDGGTQLMDEVLERVIASWNAIFEQDKL
jgi:hypothetical protein